jgi:GTPase SAR1 family protein
MAESSLRERVEEMFEQLLEGASRRAALEPLREELRLARERMHQPMRVAIVGLVKAGKSTMLNALLGEEVVATGAIEATFNVNWLRHGPSPAIVVHYKDGRAPRPKPFAELESLTRRDARRGELLEIKYLEVAYPSEILRAFNLIDTPGLASFYEDDSANTREFLQLHAEALAAATRAEAANADAVLYLFSQSLHTAETSIVEMFQDAAMGQPTPINAIGVLTKADHYWPDAADPLEAGERIARRLREDPRARRLFYTIYPVSGFLALGARGLQADEFATLRKLAAMPDEAFERLARSVERFAGSERPEIPVAPAERRRALDRLGLYGVALARRLLRSGVSRHEELADELYARSGAPALTKLIVSHFGARAFLIKLDAGLRQLKTVCFRQRQRLAGADAQAAAEIAARLEAFESQEHAFAELRVLRDYYEGKLNFSEQESEWLLQLTGESGASLGQRLGLAEGERATIAEMLPVAERQLRHWRRRAADFRPVTQQTLDAARTLSRSCENMIYHLREAQRHLYP